MAHDPRQTVIEFLSAPVAQSHSTVIIAGDETTQHGTRRTSGGLGAIASTIRFLKERAVEHFYACIVTFEDVKGQPWEMVCLVQQDEQRNWILRNGSGGVPCHMKPMKESNMQATGVVLVSGPGTEGGFFAGGYIVGPAAHTIIRVRLISHNGVTLDDVVNAEDDGRVLFVTEQDVEAPIRIELYDDDGIVRV